MRRERTKAYVEFVAWLGLAGFLFYFSLDFREGRMGGYELGPAFWVYLILGLMVVAAFANLGIRLLATRNEQPAEEGSGGIGQWFTQRLTDPQFFKIGAVFAIPLAFVWALPRWGFYLALPLFVIAMLVALGERRPLMVTGITVAVAGALFFVFTTLLYVPMPIGRVDAFYDLNVVIRELLR